MKKNSLVKILNRDFYGKTAIVTGFTKNLFGMPLVVVRYSNDGGKTFSERTTVFYPSELAYPF